MQKFVARTKGVSEMGPQMATRSNILMPRELRTKAHTALQCITTSVIGYYASKSMHGQHKHCAHGPF